MGAYYGLGLGLGGAPVPIRGSHLAVGGSYVTLGRVLDLNTPFSELTFTLDDRSDEGNDATLYTGRYISTDGSTDRGIVADCSAAGAGSYYLTGKVRPNAVTTAELTMDGSTDSGLTGLAADVWQDFTTATASVTPSAVQVGFDGTTASAADWSDVKLIDSSDGSTVARWQLTESADGDLDGYPALDSSGNGYHGTHTGCAGGTGETDILQTAGQDWNRRMWFDGVDDKITDTGSPIADVGSIEIQFVFTDIEGVVFFSQQNGSLIYGVSITQSRTAGNVHVVFHKGGSAFETISQSGFTAGDVIAAKANYDFITNTFSVDINGLSGDGALPGRHSGTIAINIFKIGSNGNDTFFNTGLIWNLREYAADQSTVIRYWRGTGNTNADWTDQIGSNNGTVNGSPSNYLIPESDTTAGTDALGNAIAEPRVNNKVVNIFDTETVDLPDNASLETVRSVTLAVYNDGGTKDVLQAAGGASFVDIAANTLQTDQTGTHTYYVNGAATTTLAAGWNIITIVFDAGKDFSGGKIVGTSGNLLAYDPTALTSDDALQNYNAFKHQYGL